MTLTLSDLEKRDTRVKFFRRMILFSACIVSPRTTKSDRITHVGRGVILEGHRRIYPEGRGPSAPQFGGSLLFIHTLFLSQNYQIWCGNTYKEGLVFIWSAMPPTQRGRGHHHHHHHHLVARSKSIAVSTMRRQEGRSVARRNAEWSPRLSGLRSLSTVRSQDWQGRPLGRRQSTGRRSVDARSAREWSSEAAARAICPNSLKWHCCISEETGGWSVCDRTNTLVTCAVYGTRRIRRKHHWSKEREDGQSLV